VKRRSMALLVSRGEGDRVVLLSPAVGLYRGAPLPGEGLRPGSLAGTLRVMGQVIDLHVPEQAAGRLVEIRVHDHAHPVAYGEPLLVLDPTAAHDTDLDSFAGAPGGRAADDPEESRLGAGLYALRATTAGVFYARSDPASAPFVEKGATLVAGQTAGLIEVMKCFSPIVHPGEPLPSPGTVHEIRASDGQEVRPGQILFVLRTP
jgi:biotin carboxyl carrier protein